MTKTKYLLSTLLIAICLFIAGEIQPMIANYNFTSFTNSSYNIGEKTTKEESPEKLKSLTEVFTVAAEENDIGIFITKYETKSNLEETEYFYCAGDASDHVKKAIDGHYSYDSILSGKISYTIRPIQEITSLDSVITIYFCGEEKSVNNAKEYIGEYISEVRIDASSQDNIYRYIEVGAFALVFILIIMFSISDVNIKKKEYVLKYIYGESKLYLISRYYITDVIVYCTIIAIETLAIMQLNSIAYCLGDIIVFAICILVGTFLCYIPLLKVNPVYALKGQESKKKVLSANWMIKIMISALIVCVTAFFITLLNDSQTYIKTADFFQSHSDYYFCYMEADSDLESMMYNRDTYVDRNYRTACDYYDICSPLLINHEMYVTYDDQEEGANGYYIFANANAIEYLKTVIKELSQTPIKSDYIIIVPKQECDDAFVEKSLEEINSRYKKYIYEDVQLYTKENIQIVETKHNYEVFATDNDKESEMGIFRNEPVIICTVPENQSKYSPKEMNLATQSYYMFKMDDALKNELVSKENLTKFTETNCKEQYDYFWRMNRLGLIYFGSFSIILVILEITVLSFVVKLEFDMNKEEMSIKKVLGYTLLSRYGELIATTLLSSFICCAISIYALSQFDTNTPAIAAVVISLILLILEFVIIVFNAIRLEKANIQKILKGGAL